VLFIEPRFFLFLAVVFGVHWLLKTNRPRKLWLLACSYVFYGAWDWRFLSLILASTAIDYVAALRIDAASDRRIRRRWLLLSLGGNLAILGFFKYFNFFTGSLVSLAAWLGAGISGPTLDIVLPVGISFYTFQTMSYSLDVYFGRLKPTGRLLDVALFVAFFPQLVAGPIVRAAGFIPQLASKRSFPAAGRVRALLVLFLVGFFKKACVSDNLAPYVDRFFEDPGAFGAFAAWTAVLFYAVQIYCDFSGYSDMAIACAGLLGYQLVLNFAFPYFAGSITEFWRRWHMSLSSWLRDYLYIPLGGSRGGRIFTLRNLMLTMLLGGLWHGAAWNFVLWGGLHGVALAIHRRWSDTMSGAVNLLNRALAVIGPLLTFYWVCITWIFFRAETLPDAIQILRSFVLLDAPGTSSLPIGPIPIMAMLVLLHALAYRKTFDGLWRQARPQLFSAAYGAAWALALALVPMGARPFIYFQF
jgi:alginate O-acetyltransferase complex protein AlgI